MTDETVIPQNLVDFARALCRCARQHGIDDMTVRFNTGIHNRDLKWPAPITLMWEQGRHGAADDKMVLTSEVVVRTKIEGPFELDPEVKKMAKSVNEGWKL